MPAARSRPAAGPRPSPDLGGDRALQSPAGSAAEPGVPAGRSLLFLLLRTISPPRRAAPASPARRRRARSGGGRRRRSGCRAALAVLGAPRSLRDGRRPLHPRTPPPPHTHSHTHTRARGGGGSPAGAARACAMSAPGPPPPVRTRQPNGGARAPSSVTGAHRESRGSGKRSLPLRAAPARGRACCRQPQPLTGPLGSPGGFVRSSANRCPEVLADAHEGRRGSWRCCSASVEAALPVRGGLAHNKKKALLH